jgi:hypothetical protein
MTLATVITYKYAAATPRGVLLADDAALHDLEGALRIAERSGDDIAPNSLDLRWGWRWCTEVHRTAKAVWQSWTGRGDLDGAVLQLRKVVDDSFDRGHLALCDLAAEALVESLLARRAEGDIEEAESVTDRLTTQSSSDGLAVIDILLLRLRALLARPAGTGSGTGIRPPLSRDGFVPGFRGPPGDVPDDGLRVRCRV